MPKREEDLIQEAVIEWYDRQYGEHHPYCKLLAFHQNGGANVGQIKGFLLKRLGVRAGIPDLVLYIAKGGWHGLFVEVKTKDGKLEKHQKEFHAKLVRQGFMVATGYGVDQSISIIKTYLQLP